MRLKKLLQSTQENSPASPVALILYLTSLHLFIIYFIDIYSIFRVMDRPLLFFVKSTFDCSLLFEYREYVLI